MIGAMLAVAAFGAANSAAGPTDFGIRVVGGSPAPLSNESPARAFGMGPAPSRPAAAIGAQWGRVTSTYRSPARNRAVGGARNSWHLSGRAIDIARRRNVSHGEIAAAFRAAGYVLIESLDEGDHSHFAFGPAERRARHVVRQAELTPAEVTKWGMVTVSARRTPSGIASSAPAGMSQAR